MSISEVKKALKYMEHPSLNEALDFILLHPYTMSLQLLWRAIIT